MDTLKTYLEVGQAEGLGETTLIRFVMYMKARWEDTEEEKCGCGYAREWAARFRGGVEYAMSDLEGQSVLEKIDEILNIE